MVESSAIPRRALTDVPAFGAAGALMIVYFVATKWLVSFGPVISPALLSWQVVIYSALAVGSLILIRSLGRDWPWASRSGLQWPAALSIAAAAAVVIIRFFWRHPRSEWRLETAQGWRDIAEGYLVGRLLVPLAEELVFRGVLFCLFDTGARARTIAVVISTACVFALLHWPALYGLPTSDGIEDVVSALAAGLAFGALRAWTRSILPGLGLHMIGNSLGF